MKNPRNVQLTIKWVLFTYVILGSIFCNFLPIPEFMKSILSLPAWLIIPYFFGECIKMLLCHLKINFQATRGSNMLSLFLGIYSLVVSNFILDLIGLHFITKNLHFFILSISFIHLLYGTLKEGPSFSILYSRRVDILAIIFSLLVSLIPASISRSVFPFPYGTIEVISIPMEQCQPALRFVEHGYLQHYRVYDYISLGFCSQLFNIDPLSFIWSASFLMMALYSIGLFLFSFSVSKSRTVALLTAFIGSFLNMNVFRDIPTLFKSNVFMYVFFAPALYLSYQNISRKEYKLKDVTLTLLLIGAIFLIYEYAIYSNFWYVFVPKNVLYPEEWKSHVWIPTVVVTTLPVLFILAYLSKIFALKNPFLGDNILLLASVIFFYISLINPECIAFVFYIIAFIELYFIAKTKKAYPLLYSFIAMVFSVILFQRYVLELPVSNPISSVILPSFAESVDAIPFSTRYQWLVEINLTPILRYALILGIVAILCSKKRENLMMASAFSLALFLYFFPEVYAYRFYREISPMMAYIIATGLCSVFKILVSRKNGFSTIIFFALVVSLLLPNLVIPIYQRHYQSPLGRYMVTEYEYLTARWLRENTPENSIILSDYVTMQLIAPLSNKLLPTARSFRIQALNENDIQTVWRIKNMLSLSLISKDLWDCRSEFWAVYKWGEGETDVDTKYINIQGSTNNGSQVIEIIKGNYAWVGIIHKFDKEQDWSNVSSIYFFWFGKNSGNKWQILVAAPDDANWFYYTFNDNFTGWRKITIQLSQFQGVNSPSWKRISYIAYRSFNPTPNTWFLGNVGLNHLYPELSYSDFDFIRQRIDTTDKRYCQYANLPWENSTILLVLTPRTVKWLKQAGISEVWLPEEGAVNPTYIEAYKKCSFLELIYSYEGKIYVFKVLQNE